MNHLERVLFKVLFAGSAGVAWGFAAPIFSREWWLIGAIVVLSNWCGMIKV